MTAVSSLPPLQIFWRRRNFLRSRGHVWVHTFFSFSMRLEIGSRVEIFRRYPFCIRTRNTIYAPRHRALINPQNVFRTYVRYLCIIRVSIYIRMLYNNSIRIKNPFSSIIYSVRLIRSNELCSDAYCFPTTRRCRGDSNTYSYCFRFVVMV